MNAQSPTAFSRKAARAGGVGVEDAVAAADARLETLRERVLGQIDLELDTIGREIARLDQRGAGARERILAAAEALAGLCGAFGMTPVGACASSLCRIAGQMGPALPASIVKVHRDAMVLLKAMPTEERASHGAALLHGLAQAGGKVTVRDRGLASIHEPSGLARRTEGSGGHGG